MLMFALGLPDHGVGAAVASSGTQRLHRLIGAGVVAGGGTGVHLVEVDRAGR